MLYEQNMFHDLFYTANGTKLVGKNCKVLNFLPINGGFVQKSHKKAI